MHTDAKRHDVRLLSAAGVPRKRIAEVPGGSIRTIRRMARDPASIAADAGGRLRRRSPGVGARAGLRSSTRFARSGGRAARRDAEDEEPRGASAPARAWNQGGRTAVHERVREVRPRIVRPICRFEGVAGEFTRHDSGRVVVEWTGGERTRVHLFASRLRYSRYSLTTHVADQRLENAGLHVGYGQRAFRWTPMDGRVRSPRGNRDEIGSEDGPGGVEPDLRGDDDPAARGDRALLAISASARGERRRSRELGQGSFFSTRKLLDEEDLQMQPKARHEEINERRPTSRIPGEVLRDVELERLRPIQPGADELDLRHPVRIGPTGMVSFEENRHSMPAETPGFSATLHAFAHHIVIRTGDHRVRHPRLPAGSPTPSSREAHRDGSSTSALADGTTMSHGYTSCCRPTGTPPWPKPSGKPSSSEPSLPRAHRTCRA